MTIALDDLLEALEDGRQRATYGAVATLLGRPAQSLMSGRPRDARNSWIVRVATDLPTGYSDREMHPELRTHPHVIAAAADLAVWLTKHGIEAATVSKSARPLGRDTPDEWDDMDPRELLATYSGVMRALRKQGVVRSSNNPVADLAEAIGCKAFDLTIADKSAKGYDGVCGKGKRWQIKSRRQTRDNPSSQLGVLRDLESRHFDYVLAICLDEHFAIRSAYKIPHEAVASHAKFRAHQRGHILHLNAAVRADKRVENVTSIVAAAAKSLYESTRDDESARVAVSSRPRSKPSNATASSREPPTTRLAASYEHSRLAFVADVIEPLASTNRFRIVTPTGTFEMTKADFYRDFANVTKSASYRDRGLYHYPTIPEKARKYIVSH